MIYITGDFSRFNTKNFPEQYEMTKDDYIIICGDFGGVWDYGEQSKEEKHLLEWLEGKTFFTFGGARSHDIKDGILESEDKEKIKKWNREYKSFRSNKRTWWEQEMPTATEMAYGLENLKKHQSKVDYIITHCGS